MNSEGAKTEIRRRWREIFRRLADGGEVPTSMRLRAEGFMEALSALGIATAEELQLSMAQCHEEAFGVSLETAWGSDWRELFPFPQVPGFGQRAPVYPSTSDSS